MNRAVVIGTSAGGLHALKTLLPALPKTFPFPLAIVQHIDERSDGYFADHLNSISNLAVKEAEDKEPMQFGTAYLAPAGYHLLIETDRTLSLSVDGRVNYCCPSIDVLFESAADAFGGALIGVILTGGNADGSHGLKVIKQRGGCAIVQNPETAETPAMPRAALNATAADHVVNLEQIAPLLIELSTPKKGEAHGPDVVG